MTAADQLVLADTTKPAANRRSAGRDAARESTRAAFRAADIRALRMAFYMRLVSLGAIAIWLGFLNGFPFVLFYWAILLVPLV